MLRIAAESLFTDAILLFLREDLVDCCPFPEFSRRRARHLSIVRTCIRSSLAAKVCPVLRRSRRSPLTSIFVFAVFEFRILHACVPGHLLRGSCHRCLALPTHLTLITFKLAVFASTMPLRVYLLRPTTRYNIWQGILQIARTVFRRATTTATEA